MSTEVLPPSRVSRPAIALPAIDVPPIIPLLRPASRAPTPAVPLVAPPAADWSDERLVGACLAGDQRAWELLIRRYKNLICSFPRKYGAPPHEAEDVLQLVCVDLFIALPRLRNKESIRAWISTIAAHHAYRWKRRHVARVSREDDTSSADMEERLTTGPSGEFLQAERERLVRAAVAQLPPQCGKVIEMLFFSEPPMSYHLVAKRLGVSPGSVSFLRARGLRKLEKLLGHVAPK